VSTIPHRDLQGYWTKLHWTYNAEGIAVDGVTHRF